MTHDVWWRAPIYRGNRHRMTPTQERREPDVTPTATYDVIEVPFDAPDSVRVIAEDKSKENAEAIVSMAVMRRGVESSYFTIRPSEGRGENP